MSSEKVWIYLPPARADRTLLSWGGNQSRRKKTQKTLNLKAEEGLGSVRLKTPLLQQPHHIWCLYDPNVLRVRLRRLLTIDVCTCMFWLNMKYWIFWKLEKNQFFFFLCVWCVLYSDSELWRKWIFFSFLNNQLL